MVFGVFLFLRECGRGAEMAVGLLAAMGFNLIILVLHVVGLLRGDNSASISELLFKDGVIFYLGAFSCNVLPAVSGSAIEPHAYIKRKTPFLHRSSTPLI